MPLRPYTLAAAVALVVGVLENVLFGSDSPGTRHSISVAFFLLTVIAAVALVAIGIAAVTRRTRSRA